MPGFDYTSTGVYFVTICTPHRECLFGEIVDGIMRLNAYGDVVAECWQAIPDHFPHATLDAFVIMPNHVHGIITIMRSQQPTRETPPVGAQHVAPLPVNVIPGSLGAIVRAFKSAVTKRINILRGTPGAPVWQRGYFDRVVRDETEMQRIRQYIADNPSRWQIGRENPARCDSP